MDNMFCFRRARGTTGGLLGAGASLQKTECCYQTFGPRLLYPSSENLLYPTYAPPTKTSGALSVYIGGAYLDATVDLTGSFVFDTSEIEDAPPETTLNYSISQSNKDKWNFMVGFNWDVSRSWSAQFEASTGGSREQFIASGTWRF